MAPEELKFRLTKGMERIFFRDADAVVMLTKQIKKELVAQEPHLANRAAAIEVIPCCVDAKRFDISIESRLAYREQRNWQCRRVVIYAGKLGPWYLPEEMARFIAVVRCRDPRFFFQVLTQSDPLLMQQPLQAAGVQPEDYDIRYAVPDELPLILTAADAALSFVIPSYSKRASSPTKVAEYLAAGLPIVTTAGIGDLDEMLGGNRLGVVVRDLTQAGYEEACEQLAALLAEEDLPIRCRRFAEAELSMTQVGGPRYAAVYERSLRSRPQATP